MPSIPGSDLAAPLLRQRIQAVFRHLPYAMAGDPERTRSMRVAARRLRVALPLLALRPGARQVTRALKRLRQLIDAAGGGRDLDVAVIVMDEAFAAGIAAPLRPETQILRRRLRAARARARRRLADALLDLEIASLRRDLRIVVARRGGPLFIALARLRDARAALSQEVVGRLAVLESRYEPHALHRLRTRTRRLRYTVEVREALSSRAPRVPALLGALQDQLGRVQDAFVLSEWLRGQASASRHRGAPGLAREARRLAEIFRAQSEAHHREFLSGHPSDALAAALTSPGRSRSAA